MDASAHPSDTALLPGERIGPYRLIEELGRGGMGVVYRADDLRLGRQVALKFLPAGATHDASATERLLAEARAAATLDHPNVCTVYEVAETDDGRPYIALACYEGETLAERLTRGPLPVGEAVRLMRGIAAGVEAAHARGIVHRDLKPSNVFLCEDGTPKVLDFGIAKVPDQALTKTGETAGTLAYGAPEQAQGRVDARSDVWALGVVLYEMLTGLPPFAAPYEAAVLYAVLHETPPPPSATADAPPALDAVVMRCLEKDPAARYADAGALGAALDGVLRPGVSEEAPGRPRTVRGLVRRSWALVSVVLVAVAALAAAGWWATRSAEAAGIPASFHLAILPPDAQPDGPDRRAFAEGLAETLAGGVLDITPPDRDVSVEPLSDVRSFDVTSARQAGAVLNADLVVTGSLRRDGNGLALTLSLTTAGDRPRLIGSRTLTVAAADEGSLRGRALGLLADLLEFPVDDARLAAGTDDPEAQAYYLQGVGYLQRDRDAQDLDRAVDLFEQAIEADSAFAEAWARLAEAALAKYQATRDPAWVDRAQAAADRADALDPNNPAVLVTRSRLALATGQAPRAVAFARRALDAAPESADALRALAAAQEHQSDLEGAEATLREVLRRAPTRWTSAFDLGAFYLRHQRLDEAAEQFEAVVALAPGNYQGHSGLGAARYFAEDLDGARVAYERVVALRPDATSALVNLGTILLAEGDAQGAAERYRQVLSLDSTHHVYWRNLASAYWDLGDQDRWAEAMRGALRQAEAGLAVNPNDAALLADAALYREGTGDPEGARRDASRAADLAPADPGVQTEAAIAFARLHFGDAARPGDLDAALDALNAATDNGWSFESAAEDDVLGLLVDHPRFPAPGRER